MKKYFTVIYLLCLFTGCSSDDNKFDNSEINEQYVVDKIYDFNNNLMAEYFYNNNKQLIKKARIVNEVEVAKHEFEYVNGSVTQIDYENYEYPSFNHTIYIFYNEEDQIIKDETHSYETIVKINDYSYNEHGQIQQVASFTEGLNTVRTYNYNATDNVEQAIAILPEFDEGGNPTGSTVEVSFEYNYDQGLKPNFGLKNIFQIEPLPGFGTEAMFEKNSSLNNMTKNQTTGTQWVYTYNENNLVGTIETIWEGIETEEPILLRIEYKLIN